MDSLGTLADATEKVLRDVRQCLDVIQRLSRKPFDTPGEGVAVLRTLRNETYEDLNQIQHEYMILVAARWLVTSDACPPTTTWSWNPRQTGTSAEPDLQGCHEGVVILSAEITTSARPIGVIDTRMGRTLEKLSELPGTLYYFVCSEAMRQRATTKTRKAGWPIRVVLLDGEAPIP